MFCGQTIKIEESILLSVEGTYYTKLFYFYPLSIKLQQNHLLLILLVNFKFYILNHDQLTNLHTPIFCNFSFSLVRIVYVRSSYRY